MDTAAYPADPELSIRGAYSGHQLGTQPLNDFTDAHPSLQEEIQKPSAASHQPQEAPRPRRLGSSAANATVDGPVDEMTVRGRYIPPGGLASNREQSKDAYTEQGTSSVQDTTMAKPPKPVSPSSNGNELSGCDGPELPMSTSADMMEPANEGTNSQWKWVQGFPSFSKKDDLEGSPEGAMPDKENMAGVAATAAGIASRDPPPSGVLAERQDQGDGKARAPGETATGGKDAKSAPGLWIKSVWGTRQEVAELDLAIQLALEVEQIDTAKYFTRDYTEFPSVAHYYVHVHDSLDLEEVDLLASFAGRMGEDHPLVQAMMEIMEEEGDGDAAAAMADLEQRPQQKDTPGADPMGVYITESGMLSSVPPNGPSPVANLPKKPTPPAKPKEGDVQAPEKRSMAKGKKPAGLVPGMDDLVNDLSAMSWLSKRKPWKPGQPILDDEEGEKEAEMAAKEATQQPKPRKSSGRDYGQAPGNQAAPLMSAAAPPAAAHGRVASPKKAPVRDAHRELERPKSPPRKPAAAVPQASAARTRNNSNGASLEVPPAHSLAKEVAASNAQHHGHAAHAHHHQPEPAKPSRGLFDILCCRKAYADEDF